MLSVRFLKRLLLCLGLLFYPWASSHAELSLEAAFEFRFFPSPGAQGQDTSQPSVRGAVDYRVDNDSHSFALEMFARLDKEDSRRTHADLREALWRHTDGNWELKVGVTKVFWGVTESRHLVDVLNQTDQVENIDGEDKLGQPLAGFSLEQGWGTLDLFWLPYFRERTFVGREGRLAFPLPVDADQARYDSSAREWHSDVAVRLSHYVGDLEFALSHFSGTSREPLLEFNGNFFEPAWIPRYTTVDQTGLELQYLYDAWLFKFEGIANTGMRERYSAAVGGFEYTQVGIFGSASDLGWIVEYLFDDRKERAPHSFERDIFVGLRYVLNDEHSSEILLGMVHDPQTHEKVISLEAGRRLSGDLKLNVDARFFQGASQPALSPTGIPVSSRIDKTWFLQSEDYVQIALVKYL